MKILNSIQSLINQIVSQLASIKGAVSLILTAVFVLDLLTNGSTGATAFALSTAKQIVAIVKGGGWEFIVALLVVTQTIKK